MEEKGSAEEEVSTHKIFNTQLSCNLSLDSVELQLIIVAQANG